MELMAKSNPGSTRSELLHAAAFEIAERGYSGASFSSVAARLGLTKGAFAYHFPTKQALAVALMEEFGNSFTRAVSRARDVFPDDDLRTALRGLGIIENMADTEPVVAAAFILMCDPQPPVEQIREKFVWWVETFSGFIERAAEMGQLELSVPIEEAAEFLVISLLGLTNLSHRMLARSSTKDQLHLQLLLTAIGVKDTAAMVNEVFGSVPA